MVQLRQHLRKNMELVPKREMREATEAEIREFKREVGHGSLHIFKGGFLMALRPGGESVEALDSTEGVGVGEWRLPSNKTWSAICGGGAHLFVLGRGPGEARAVALPRAQGDHGQEVSEACILRDVTL